MQNLYLDLLIKCILGQIYGDVELGTRSQVTPLRVENGKYWPQRAHSMIGTKRLENLRDCMISCLEDGVEGDFIETGVWRGGATILMAGVLKAYKQSDRKVFVADSFEGLPKPDADKYPVDAGDRHHQMRDLAVSLETVRGNFARYNLLTENVNFIKGFFEDTLPNAPIDKLAILRLDGDMYSSTIQALDALYDKVSVGGYIIVDDYGLKGAKAAIDDFREKRGIVDQTHQIDLSGAIYWRKLKARVK